MSDEFINDRTCLFIKGFPAESVDFPELVRAYFQEKVGKCTIEFTAKSKDKRWFFIVVGFESTSIAADVLERYQGKDILGHRVSLSYWRVRGGMATKSRQPRMNRNNVRTARIGGSRSNVERSDVHIYTREDVGLSKLLPHSWNGHSSAVQYEKQAGPPGSEERLYYHGEDAWKEHEFPLDFVENQNFLDFERGTSEFGLERGYHDEQFRQERFKMGDSGSNVRPVFESDAAIWNPSFGGGSSVHHPDIVRDEGHFSERQFDMFVDDGTRKPRPQSEQVHILDKKEEPEYDPRDSRPPAIRRKQWARRGRAARGTPPTQMERTRRNTFKDNSRESRSPGSLERLIKDRRHHSPTFFESNIDDITKGSSSPRKRPHTVSPDREAHIPVKRLNATSSSYRGRRFTRGAKHQGILSNVLSSSVHWVGEKRGDRASRVQSPHNRVYSTNNRIYSANNCVSSLNNRTTPAASENSRDLDKRNLRPQETVSFRGRQKHDLRNLLISRKQAKQLSSSVRAVTNEPKNKPKVPATLKRLSQSPLMSPGEQSSQDSGSSSKTGNRKRRKLNKERSHAPKTSKKPKGELDRDSESAPSSLIVATKSSKVTKPSTTETAKKSQASTVSASKDDPVASSESQKEGKLPNTDKNSSKTNQGECSVTQKTKEVNSVEATIEKEEVADTKRADRLLSELAVSLSLGKIPVGRRESRESDSKEAPLESSLETANTENCQDQVREPELYSEFEDSCSEEECILDSSLVVDEDDESDGVTRTGVEEWQAMGETPQEEPIMNNNNSACSEVMHKCDVRTSDKDSVLIDDPVQLDHCVAASDGLEVDNSGHPRHDSHQTITVKLKSTVQCSITSRVLEGDHSLSETSYEIAETKSNFSPNGVHVEDARGATGKTLNISDESGVFCENASFLDNDSFADTVRNSSFVSDRFKGADENKTFCGKNSSPGCSEEERENAAHLGESFNVNEGTTPSDHTAGVLSSTEQPPNIDELRFGQNKLKMIRRNSFRINAPADCDPIDMEISSNEDSPVKDSNLDSSATHPQGLGMIGGPCFPEYFKSHVGDTSTSDCCRRGRTTGTGSTMDNCQLCDMEFSPDEAEHDSSAKTVEGNGAVHHNGPNMEKEVGNMESAHFNFARDSGFKNVTTKKVYNTEVEEGDALNLEQDNPQNTDCNKVNSYSEKGDPTSTVPNYVVHLNDGRRFEQIKSHAADPSYDIDISKVYNTEMSRDSHTAEEQCCDYVNLDVGFHSRTIERTPYNKETESSILCADMDIPSSKESENYDTVSFSNSVHASVNVNTKDCGSLSSTDLTSRIDSLSSPTLECEECGSPTKTDHLTARDNHEDSDSNKPYSPSSTTSQTKEHPSLDSLVSRPCTSSGASSLSQPTLSVEECLSSDKRGSITPDQIEHSDRSKPSLPSSPVKEREHLSPYENGDLVPTEHENNGQYSSRDTQTKTINASSLVQKDNSTPIKRDNSNDGSPTCSCSPPAEDVKSNRSKTRQDCKLHSLSMPTGDDSKNEKETVPLSVDTLKADLQGSSATLSTINLTIFDKDVREGILTSNKCYQAGTEISSHNSCAKEELIEKAKALRRDVDIHIPPNKETQDLDEGISCTRNNSNCGDKVTSAFVTWSGAFGKLVEDTVTDKCMGQFHSVGARPIEGENQPISILKSPTTDGMCLPLSEKMPTHSPIGSPHRLSDEHEGTAASSTSVASTELTLQDMESPEKHTPESKTVLSAPKWSCQSSMRDPLIDGDETKPKSQVALADYCAEKIASSVENVRNIEGDHFEANVATFQEGIPCKEMPTCPQAGNPVKTTLLLENISDNVGNDLRALSTNRCSGETPKTKTFDNTFKNSETTYGDSESNCAGDAIILTSPSLNQDSTVKPSGGSDVKGHLAPSEMEETPLNSNSGFPCKNSRPAPGTLKLKIPTRQTSDRSVKMIIDGDLTSSKSLSMSKPTVDDTCKRPLSVTVDESLFVKRDTEGDASKRPLSVTSVGSVAVKRGTAKDASKRPSSVTSNKKRGKVKRATDEDAPKRPLSDASNGSLPEKRAANEGASKGPLSVTSNRSVFVKRGAEEDASERPLSVTSNESLSVKRAAHERASWGPLPVKRRLDGDNGKRPTVSQGKVIGNENSTGSGTTTFFHPTNQSPKPTTHGVLLPTSSSSNGPCSDGRKHSCSTEVSVAGEPKIMSNISWAIINDTNVNSQSVGQVNSSARESIEGQTFSVREPREGWNLSSGESVVYRSPSTGSDTKSEAIFSNNSGSFRDENEFRMQRLRKKKEEIEQGYRRDCNTVINVVKMLVSNDPRLESLLQVAVTRSLREMGERCVEELKKHVILEP